MIPKIIHYCWLSTDPIPNELKQYIRTWESLLPEYEFMLWNFDRFNPADSIWVSQAFESKKYAFAADYIRLYALLHYGGIYLDMDVEVLQSFDPFLQLNTMLCYEAFGDRYEMATVGVAPGTDWVQQALSYYDRRSFIQQDGQLDTKVLPKIIMEIIKQGQYVTQKVYSLEEAVYCELQGIIPIFSSDFFSPKEYSSGKIKRSRNTISIHHFSGSWLPKYVKWEHKFWQFLGLNDPNFLTSLMKLKRILFK